MVLLEIPPNPNCDAVDQRVFNDTGPAAPVTQVKLDRGWCAITGWTLDNTPCPATAQKVDDSGEGVVFLIAGGDAGLRLQLAETPTPWRLNNSRQWGESFLLIADSLDLKNH